MTHTFLKIIPVIALSLVTVSAQAIVGGGDSGGGSVVVCRNSTGAIESIQLLDLFEGKVRHRHVHPVLNLPHNEIVERLIPRLTFASYESNDGHWSLPEELKTELHLLMQKSEFLPDGVGLNQPTDLGSSYAIVVPEGCRIEAAGFREANGTFVIASSLYEALDEVNKAAFWLHEAIYSVYTRTNLVNTSEGTRPIRKLVSTVFAKNTDLSSLAEATTFFFRRVDAFQLGTVPTVTSRIFLNLSKSEANFTLGYRIGTFANVPGSSAPVPSEFGQYFTCEGWNGTVAKGKMQNSAQAFYALLDLTASECRNDAADSVLVTVSNVINLEGSVARDGQTIMKVTDNSGRLVLETETNPIVIRRRPVRDTVGIKFNMKMNVYFLKDRATYRTEVALAKYPF